MKYICFLAIILLISSCQKEEIQGIQDKKYTAEILSGNRQNGIVNQELDSTIAIKITNKDGLPYSKAKISFLTSDGNLFSEHDYFSEFFYVHWLLGCNTGMQNTKIILNDSADRLIDTISIFALAKKDTLWNRVCGLPLMVDNYKFIFSPIRKFIEHPDGSLYTIVFPNAYSSLYISSDNGECWSEKYTLSDYIRINDITLNDKGYFFMSAENGLFKSVDCKSWKKVIDKSIAKCFTLDSLTFFACGSTSPDIYRSDNNGETWSNLTISYNNQYNVIQYSGYIKQLKRVDENKILLLNDVNDLLISNDNGVTWKIFGNTNTFMDITGFYIKGNTIYLVNITGAESIPMVYKSDLNGMSWTLFCILTHRPYNYYEVSEIQHYADNLYFLTDNCIYKINQNGDTLNITKNIWNKMNGISKFIISKNGYLIVGSEYKDNGVFYSKINVP